MFGIINVYMDGDIDGLLVNVGRVFMSLIVTYIGFENLANKLQWHKICNQCWAHLTIYDLVEIHLL